MERVEVERRKDLAVRFVEHVLGDSERADEIELESVEDYAARRGFVLKNPHYKEDHTMKTKSELEIEVAEKDELLEEVYDMIGGALGYESSAEDDEGDESDEGEAED